MIMLAGMQEESLYVVFAIDLTPSFHIFVIVSKLEFIELEVKSPHFQPEARSLPQ